MDDFTTLGEYLPGDSGSSATRVQVHWGSLSNPSAGWIEYFLATAAGGSTRTTISFGSLASATSPAKGILFYNRVGASDVAANDMPMFAWDFNGTVNGDGTTFTVDFNNNHSFLLAV